MRPSKMPLRKGRAGRLWNFNKQGYPPGIDPIAAEKEAAEIREGISVVFGAYKRKKRKKRRL